MRARVVAGPTVALLLVTANVLAAWIASAGTSLCGGDDEAWIGLLALSAVVSCAAAGADTSNELGAPPWGSALVSLGAAGAAALVCAAAWFIASFDACFVF